MAKAPLGQTTSKSGGGTADPNILKLGDTNRIRLLDPAQEGAERWRQHSVNGITDEEQFRSVVCPRGHDGRTNATCPLCAKPADENGKQRFAVSRRFAINVWDYESGSVKVMIAGPQIFEEFDANVEAGIDVLAYDWIVTKAGKGINTKYRVVRGEDKPLPQEITQQMLHDTSKYAEPTSVEKIFEVLEEMGYDYDSLEMPSFTSEQAEAFVMPFGKHKGMTLEQLIISDPDYLEYLYGKMLDGGNLGDTVFVAIRQILVDHGQADPDDVDIPEAPTAAEQIASAPATPAPAPAATPAHEPEKSTVTVYDAEGTPFEVPVAAAQPLIDAGYTRENPALAKKDDAPPIPADDDEVTFKLNVVPAPVGMAFKDARRLLLEGEGQFAGIHEWLNTVLIADADDAAVVEQVEADIAADPQVAPAGQNGSGATEDPFDPALIVEKDGEFSHPALGKTYKAKSGLSAALNRERKKLAEGVTPEQASEHDQKLAQARALIDKATHLKNDFNQLLALFEEVAGTRVIADFTDEQLDQLINRLEVEAALA